MKLRYLVGLLVLVAFAGALVWLGIRANGSLGAGPNVEDAKQARTIIQSTLPISLKWKTDLKEAAAHYPLVANDTVLIRTNNSLVALSAENGVVDWDADTGILLTIWGVDATANTVVYSSDRQTKINSVRVQNGQSLWDRGPDNLIANLLNPTVYQLLIDQTQQQLYVARTRDSRLYAYSLKDGNVAWVYNHEEASGFSSFYLQGDLLYVFWSDDLYVLDVDTGKLRRRVSDQFTEGAPVAISQGNVLLSRKGELTAKNLKTGLQSWQFAPPCAFPDVNPLLPTVMDNWIYVWNGCRKIYALEAATGKLIWEMQVEGNTISPIVAIGESGYAMLSNGTVIAFDLRTGAEQGILVTDPPRVNPQYLSGGVATDGRQLFVNFGDRTVFAFAP
jgi:outer membrane protein assembly factor BamB